jgi:hypothetical protein
VVVFCDLVENAFESGFMGCVSSFFIEGNKLVCCYGNRLLSPFPVLFFNAFHASRDLLPGHLSRR